MLYFSGSSRSSSIIFRTNELTKLVHDSVCATVRIARPQPSNIENKILYVLEDLNIKAFYISKIGKTNGIQNTYVLKRLKNLGNYLSTNLKFKAFVYWKT